MTRFEDLTQEQQELIRRHLDLVIEANKTTNLTRIDGVDDGMLLHVEDSLVGLEELNAAPEGLYADLGTGAGYPGIPLAITSGRDTLLVDARQKKTVILDSFIEELGLTDYVSTYAGRAELLARSRFAGTGKPPPEKRRASRVLQSSAARRGTRPCAEDSATHGHETRIGPGVVTQRWGNAP